MRFEAALKSGTVVAFDADELTVVRNGLGEMTTVKWVTPADFTRKLVYLNLDEVAAIVRVAENGNEEPDAEEIAGKAA
jgi:hypothetical protein